MYKDYYSLRLTIRMITVSLWMVHYLVSHIHYQDILTCGIMEGIWNIWKNKELKIKITYKLSWAMELQETSLPMSSDVLWYLASYDFIFIFSKTTITKEKTTKKKSKNKMKEM